MDFANCKAKHKKKIIKNKQNKKEICKLKNKSHQKKEILIQT
jgi:hypothetical protein